MKLSLRHFLLLSLLGILLAGCNEPAAVEPVTVQLRVDIVGETIDNTVISDPEAIVCGRACAAELVQGQRVVLTARAGTQSVFEGWSGCDEVVEQQCIVTLDDSRDVKAAFEPAQFTLVVLPDTQFYSETDSLAGIYEAQTRWIVDNLAEKRIAFVSHEGDLVQHGGVRSEWVRADRAMDLLDGQVPYSAAIGDHDYMETELRSSGAALYLEYFGAARYRNYDWYGGTAPNGLGHFQFFTAGGRTFLHLALEWGAPGPVTDPTTPLGWANSVLKRYPDIPTIVTTHSYMWDRVGAEGHAPIVEDNEEIGSSGVTIFEDLIKPNPQVFMTLSGNYHRGPEGNNGEWQQVSTNDAGLPVYEMLANYQTYTNGGDGWLRLLEFLPAGGAGGLDRIRVKTYSPTLDAYRTGERSQFFYDLDFDARFGAIDR